MGRDWSWLGGGKKKSSSKSEKDTKNPPPSSPPGGVATSATGCMSAVFTMFDLHHLQFPLNHHHLHLPKGVDAPRSSLESSEQEEDAPFSPKRKDGNLNISMGIKIKTKPQARSSLSSSSSHTLTESYSPSVKTPTLVARLMGLDLVPENYKSSPTPSSSSIDLKTPTRTSSHNNKHKHKHYSLQRNSIDGGTRSLPETPRISLGRRSVDVHSYEHQRSSFHLNNNNNNNLKFTKVKEMKIHEDKENRSPREYARQIVMQLKENVSRRRKMGTDITNTTRNNNKEQDSRESTKSPKITTITHDASPRLRLVETPKTKPPQSNNIPPKTLETTMKVQDKTKLPTRVPTMQDEGKQRKIAKKCKKPPRTMQEEPFIRPPTTSNGLQGDKSSCKRTTTSLSINDLINFNSVPSLHTIKKKDSSSPLHKSSNFHVDRETQSSRNRASHSNQRQTQQTQPQTRFPQTQPQTRFSQITDFELEYITRTLRRTGIDRDTPIAYAKWFSSSHPLDPSIFYFLEHFSNSLSLRCNRKLLFHLTDELLADFLKPQSNRNLKGFELINELTQRIEKFPLKRCLFLEDIDELVAGDLPETTTEGEEVVTEIERGILEMLVDETMTYCYDTWRITAPFDDVSGTWGVHVTKSYGSYHDSSSMFRNPRG